MAEYALDCFDKKFIFCGDYCILKEYSMPYVLGEHKEHNFRNFDNTDREKRIDNLKRARDRVAALVYANLTPHTKFLTLTTKECILDVPVFQRKLQTFLQAMKRNGYDLNYLYVYERQKKRGLKEGNIGALHVHMIIFNDEKIDLNILKKCWHYGNIDIHMLDGLRKGGNASELIRNPAAYVCKYITKESVAEWNEKTYRTSKGLKKPVEINSKGYLTENCFTRSPDGEILVQFFNETYIPFYETCKNIRFFVGGKAQKRMVNITEALRRDSFR